jgi:hypothetical protein
MEWKFGNEKSLENSNFENKQMKTEARQYSEFRQLAFSYMVDSCKPEGRGLETR